MPEFPGSPVFAPVNLPVKNDSRPDAFADQNGYKIGGLANFLASEPKLCQSDRVGIVLDRRRKICFFFYNSGNIPIAPLKIRHIPDLPAHLIGDSRHADSD